jgi:hypothetical protein
LPDQHIAGWGIRRCRITNRDAALAAERGVTEEVDVSNGYVDAAHDDDVALVSVDQDIPGRQDIVRPLNTDCNIARAFCLDCDVIAADRIDVAVAGLGDDDIAGGAGARGACGVADRDGVTLDADGNCLVAAAEDGVVASLAADLGAAGGGAGIQAVVAGCADDVGHVLPPKRFLIFL